MLQPERHPAGLLLGILGQCARDCILQEALQSHRGCITVPEGQHALAESGLSGVRVKDFMIVWTRS